MKRLSINLRELFRGREPPSRVDQYIKRLKEEGLLGEDAEENLLLLVQILRELKAEGYDAFEVTWEKAEEKMREIKQRKKE